MALDHLLLSDETGAWPAIGCDFVDLVSSKVNYPHTLLDTGIIEFTIDFISVFVRLLDSRASDIHEEDKGFRPTFSATFRASWGHALEAEMIMLGVAGRYISSKRAQKVALYRNHEDKFLIQDGFAIEAYGVNELMHQSLIEQIDSTAGFYVQVKRWLGEKRK